MGTVNSVVHALPDQKSKIDNQLFLSMVSSSQNFIDVGSEGKEYKPDFLQTGTMRVPIETPTGIRKPLLTTTLGKPDHDAIKNLNLYQSGVLSNGTCEANI